MCFNKRNHFRKNNSVKAAGHPTYIFAKQGKSYKYIGITHAPITKGIKNIALENNPQPNRTEQSYLRPQVDKSSLNNFGPKLKDWKLKSKKDKKVVKQVIKKSLK